MKIKPENRLLWVVLAACLLSVGISTYIDTVPSRATDTGKTSASSSSKTNAPNATAQQALNDSLAAYQRADYELCIRLSVTAIQNDHNYAEAWSNKSAAETQLGRYDDAIRDARQAVRLKPAMQLAVNNLKWAELEKAKHWK